MANFKRDGLELEIPDSAVPIVKNWLDKADEKIQKLEDARSDLGKKFDALTEEKVKLEASLAELKKEQDKKDGENLALKAENEKLKLNKLDAAAIANRVKLQRKAYPIIKAANSTFEEDKLDAMSDREIKILTISSKWAGKFDADYFKEKSDEAIEGMISVIEATAPTNPLRQALDGGIDSINSVSNWDAAIELQKKEREDGWKWIEKAAGVK